MRRFAWTAWIATVVAAAGVAPAWGQSLCDAEAPGDRDSDGFENADECRGIQLRPGLTFLDTAGNPTAFVPGCPLSELPGEFCLDPDKQNLFVIVVKASPAGLPDELLSFTTAPEAEGGLNVSVHLLEADDPNGDRTVSDVSAQKAVRITESLDAPGDLLGLANYGSPNGLDGSRVWTARIEEFVAAECPNDLCQTDRPGDPPGRAAVVDALTRWVLNHELGHLFALTADYNRRFGGYHVKAGEDEVMTQFVGYNTHKKTGMTTFFIPRTYSDRSRADKRLR